MLFKKQTYVVYIIIFSASNPSKKARNEEKIIEDPVQSIPDIYHEPSKYLAPRPKRYVFRLVPPEPHVPITTYTGQKLFIRLRSEESLQQKVGYYYYYFIFFLHFKVFYLLSSFTSFYTL